ncbi:MAG: hypothetical protein JJ892_03100 [Balneola sp.]|nr:hypothetical protein [Balneola sp.]
MKSTAPKEQSLHFWLILEYVSNIRRPFVMISRCNGVRANNSCRELLVLLSAQKYIGPKKLLRSREGSVLTQSIATRLNVLTILK